MRICLSKVREGTIRRRRLTRAAIEPAVHRSFGLASVEAATIAFALLPLVLIAIQTQVIAREERYLEAKFGDDYRRYKAEVRRWL